MEGGPGRGGRHGYTGRGAHGGGASHMSSAGGVTYGGMPGYVFNPWLGFNAYNVQGLMSGPHLIPHSYTRGSASSRPAATFVPLAVQGAGILKRPTGPPQGPLVHGRGHSRGHGGGRSWGSRGRKEKNLANLTKEALDADLDEWRMRDKKFGGQSLDADLDEYWKKKAEIDVEQDDDATTTTTTTTKDSKSKSVEASGSFRQEVLKDEKNTSRLSNGHKDSSSDGTKIEKSL